ncbi:MAG: glycosyltransferase family 2 protein [Pseudonocardiaceae bacterium]
MSSQRCTPPTRSSFRIRGGRCNSQSRGDWRWLLQVDGSRDDKVRESLAKCGALDDLRVRLAMNGTREGAAVSRNVALGRSTAPLIQTLDADDLLEPDAIETLAETLETHPDAGFAVGHARDLLPSGELRSHVLPLQAGKLDLLLAVGGWSALHGMEDIGLLMAASALADGVLIDKPTLRYRKHPAQQSSQRSKFRGGGAQIALVRRRVAVLAAGQAWCWYEKETATDERGPS